MRTASGIIVILILFIIFWPTDSTQLESESRQTPQSKHSPDLQNHAVEKQRSTRVIRPRTKKKVQEGEPDLFDGGNVLIPITGENGTPTIQVISFERIDATGKRFWPPKPE